VKRALLAVAAAAACHGGDAPARPPPQTIKVAVIGGMLETGFWPELVARYERMTGNHVELVASGPKPEVVAAYRRGGVDLVTFHACDAFVNLVADGLAVDPEPWARNDLVLVGPADDPAHVRGEPDIVTALGKLAQAKAPIIVHASMGADGVLHDLVEAGHIAFAPGELILFDGENQHEVLERAASAHAYTLVGRIPFVDGKLRNDGIELMVHGDPRLRRPYLVATAPGAPAAARDLAAFLRDPATQEWIGAFGKGRYDDAPLFFPVTVSPPLRSP
jgi:tungstate transport system substrate-binding protein